MVIAALYILKQEEISDLANYTNFSERLGGELGGAVLSYGPLVRATAYRYQGRGADFDDLVQEGYLALLLLIPKCDDTDWLPAFLKNRLPGYVRAAAARLRGGRGENVIELEAIEETVKESESPAMRSENELHIMLEKALTEEELDMTQALLEGFTQKELAVLFDITQQAVSVRVGKIRDKLRPLTESL